jgi:hypothetical protein
MKTQVVAMVVGGLILSILQALVGVAFGPAIEVPAGAGPWLLLSNVLVTGVLAWLGRRSVWTGWRLSAALAVVSFGIGHANSLIEAYFFKVLAVPVLQSLFWQSLVTVTLFAPIMVMLVGRWRHREPSATRPPERTAPAWVLRFAGCSFAYLVLYLIAGMIIFPFVEDFYSRMQIPSPLTVIGLQLFLRGPILTAIGFLIVRMSAATRGEHALMVAAAMSIIGGVAPLVVPNSFFPDAVRWVHFAEVVSSNFVFGAIVGWLLGGTQPQGEKALSTAA